MVSQHHCVLETFIALVAGVRRLYRMRQHVRTEAVRSIKGFATKVADVCADVVLMDFAMQRERSLVFVDFVAIWAWVRLVVDVCASVTIESAPVVEGLVADRTEFVLLLKMGSLVRAEAILGLKR